MAEPADADDADAFRWAGAVLAEWGVGRYAAAEHRRGFLRRDGRRDRDHEVAVSAPVFGVPAIRFGVVRPFRVVRVHAVVLAVLLKVFLALVAVAPKAGSGLCADAHAVADFDVRAHVLADTDRFADNLVAHDDRVVGWAPARSQSVEVRSAHTAVGDLDVDIVFFKWLGGVALVHHFALGGFGAKPHPAFELVLGLCHDDFVCSNICSRYVLY